MVDVAALCAELIAFDTTNFGEGRSHAGFDAAGRRTFVEGKHALLDGLHRRFMDEAARCERVLLMREGKLVADASPDELRQQTGEDDLEQAFLVLAEKEAA